MNDLTLHTYVIFRIYPRGLGCLFPHPCTVSVERAHHQSSPHNDDQCLRSECPCPPHGRLPRSYEELRKSKSAAPFKCSYWILEPPTYWVDECTQVEKDCIESNDTCRLQRIGIDNVTACNRVAYLNASSN